MTQRILILLLFGLLLFSSHLPARAAPEATIYYVSSQGKDTNNGRSESTPFATISKVNGLALQPGDRVLFKCGDVWRADPLVITRSGSSGSPITFSSYPAGCTNQPVLSGAQPVATWTPYSGNLYVTDLSAGTNAGKFTNGVNQLFRNGTRLVLGRWPNLDAGDGYSTIDAQPASNQITDNALPSGSWNGAVAHIRGMRWYILNRQVTATSGKTLTLGASNDCWGGNCTGWGYFLNNHLNTLDRDGEWYYNATTHRLYLYATGGAPADNQIEGSVILHTDDRSWGGVQLGQDLLGHGIAYVTVENLAVHGWFRNGIAYPTNLANTENHDLIITKNTITDVDGIGINLETWVYEATDGLPDSWRGGYNITVNSNLISHANHMGINSYARQSTITGNTIQDVGLVENLGAAGLGCAFDAYEGACTEDGDGIRLKVDSDSPNNTSNYVTVSSNRLERIAYNGMDIFGHHNTVEHNVIVQACYTKGDCGGVRTFGRSSLASSSVHDLTFHENIILDTIGNTDGCHTSYQTLFGFGLYFDNYSRDIAADGNTIINATAPGILYQNSTGTVTNNTLYNNSQATSYNGQVEFTSAPTYISNHSGNILYSLTTNGKTLSAANSGRLGTSDYNYFFAPYLTRHIAVAGDKTLAEWQSFSGKDAHSKAAWFSLSPGDAPNSSIFYNDTPYSKIVDLGTVLYKDLDQNPVYGQLTLPPYQSKILIEAGQAADLLLTMSAVGSTDTFPGLPVTYTLRVENQGGMIASQIVLTHTLPAEISGINWQASPGGVTLRPGTSYIWDLPDLSPGASLIITVTGQYSNTLTPGTPLWLSATVGAAAPEGPASNNRAVLLLGTWHRVYLPLVLE